MGNHLPTKTISLVQESTTATISRDLLQAEVLKTTEDPTQTLKYLANSKDITGRDGFLVTQLRPRQVRSVGIHFQKDRRVGEKKTHTHTSKVKLWYKYG